MKRRPWPIVILALFQIVLEPASNLFLNSWMSGVSPRVYLAYFIENQQWLTLFYLFVLPPIMGVSVYAMKKWSYAVFVLSASWMLFKNFSTFHDESVRTFSYSVAMYLGNIGFVTYFLLPRVHAPYLNPKLRWWESKTRFLVDWPCRISGLSDSAVRIQDFSEGGIFLLSSEKIELNQIIHLRFSPTSLASSASSEVVTLKAKTVFSRPVAGSTGYGVQFVELDRSQKKYLAQLAKKLKLTGASFKNTQEDSWSAFTSWAKRLITTGHGLLPETEAAQRKPVSVAQVSPSENVKAS